MLLITLRKDTIEYYDVKRHRTQDLLWDSETDPFFLKAHHSKVKYSIYIQKWQISEENDPKIRVDIDIAS